jgi:predicted phosphodiesterase
MVYLAVVLALLYDIHGNLPALEAVLADAHAQGAGRYVLGGDYAAFGAWPAQTVARLDELQDATWIRGNWERWQIESEARDMPTNDVVRGALRAVLKDLDPELVARLGALPMSAVVDGTLYCHASPASDMRAFSLDPSPADAELLEGVRERRVVFGHTHVQFQRTTEEGVELLNPGSVGLPLDGNTRAAYALVTPDGTVVLRRVAYDYRRASGALRRRNEAWAGTIATRLEFADSA